MSAIDAERFLDHLPVAMPERVRNSLDGRRARHRGFTKAIITADGHMISKRERPVEELAADKAD
jgi:hypothetical protein